MDPEFFESFDQTKLAYFYIPANEEKAILLFLPCGGGHINRNYLHMGEELAHYGVSSYLMDPRGHGLSEGRRGDTPTADHIFQDLRGVLGFITQRHPNVQLFVGGHSATGGLWLNFLNSPEACDYPIKRVFFVAPNFGPLSNTYRRFARDPFIRKVRRRVLALYQKTDGKLFKHTYVVFLRYTQEMRSMDRLLVEAYTPEMIKALVPHDPNRLIKELKVPFDLVIGKRDQLLSYKKLTEFCSQSKLFRCLHCNPSANHLSIIRFLAVLFQGQF